jgi:hypothetical protein
MLCVYLPYNTAVVREARTCDNKIQKGDTVEVNSSEKATFPLSNTGHGSGSLLDPGGAAAVWNVLLELQLLLVISCSFVLVQ